MATISKEEFAQMAAEISACHRAANDPVDAEECRRANARLLELERAMDATAWEFDEEGDVVPKKA
jgi:hypothetical protein